MAEKNTARIGGIVGLQIYSIMYLGEGYHIALNTFYPQFYGIVCPTGAPYTATLNLMWVRVQRNIFALIINTVIYKCICFHLLYWNLAGEVYNTEWLFLLLFVFLITVLTSLPYTVYIFFLYAPPLFWSSPSFSVIYLPHTNWKFLINYVIIHPCYFSSYMFTNSR